MLIKPIYRGTIDTSEDMLRSEAKLVIEKDTATEVLVKEDKRSAVQKMYENSISATLITEKGQVFPDFLKDGYVGRDVAVSVPIRYQTRLA